MCHRLNELNTKLRLFFSQNTDVGTIALKVYSFALGGLLNEQFSQPFCKVCVAFDSSHPGSHRRIRLNFSAASLRYALRALHFDSSNAELSRRVPPHVSSRVDETEDSGDSF